MAGFEPLCSDVGSDCSANCGSIFFFRKPHYLHSTDCLSNLNLRNERFYGKLLCKKLSYFLYFNSQRQRILVPKGGGEKNEKMHSLAIRNFKNFFTKWKKLTQSLKKDFFQLCLNKKKFKITFCKLGWNPQSQSHEFIFKQCTTLV